ncbi:MAG: hypothetical protein JXD23_11685 [Spirochaetales bacterium]|nr:hypothetical protein [Spirochaetales bacterium]
MSAVIHRDEIVIFNVPYTHIIFDNRDELYVTRFGLPYLENLYPENIWTDAEWFSRNSVRLCGTSCLYRVRARSVNGRSRDVVIKWNRMGQEIPGSEFDERLIDAEFLSPFEEFSLVMELRRSQESGKSPLMTHKPYAVYVPAERVAVWQSGRREDKFDRLVRDHKDVAIDINRLYAVVYEWIRGKDAAELCAQGILPESEIEKLTLRVDKLLADNGFAVRDRKPQHIILRQVGRGKFLHDRSGEYRFGLVDFELLERLPELENQVRRSRRTMYLQKQKDRFNPVATPPLPPHLSRVTIMGVDYVYGRVPSTSGALWVVGLDPDLFEYFLPEKWEQTKHIKLSVDHEIFYTMTKDNVHLVFKLSKVGMKPDLDPFKEGERLIIEHGYNSPFEEVSLAFELSQAGIPTIYPRGIYQAGYKIGVAKYLVSETRIESHRALHTPDGRPVLESDRDYIIIYGYWNGPDEKLSQKDSDYYEGIDALRAYKEKLIDQETYLRLVAVMKERLMKAGMEDLNLKGSHFLLSFDSSGRIIRNADGVPDMRYSNFEFLRKL